MSAESVDVTLEFVTLEFPVVEMFRQATGYVLLDIHPGNVAFAD
jgi:hypothetical protein